MAATEAAFAVNCSTETGKIAFDLERRFVDDRQRRQIKLERMRNTADETMKSL